MGSKSSKRSLLREGFIHNLSLAEQDAIVEALTRATLLFLRSQRAVYLEGFGILQPKTFEAYRSYFNDESQLSRIESIFRPEFHKCSELTTYHRQRYPSIVELAELAQLTYAQLPVERAALWSNKQLRQYIIGLFEALKHETVSQGCSAKLSKLGTFYALHNRQGSDFSDWFAGSDIFLSPAGEEPIRCGDARIFPRPKLESLSELAISVFGTPLETFTVKFQEIHSQTDSEGDFSIRAFCLKEHGQTILIFLTDGVRKLSLIHDTSKKKLPHFELAFQVALDDNSPADAALPTWPRIAICEALKIIVSGPTTVPPIGTVISMPDSISSGNENLSVAALVVTDFIRFHRDQLAVDGPFTIRNLVGITADEARVGHERAPIDLIRCLKHRSLAQVTKLVRPSIFTRSAFFGSNLVLAATKPKEQISHPATAEQLSAPL